MEELASTVKQNTDNAHQADELAKKASDVAQRGGVAVSDVVGSMSAISASSGKIRSEEHTSELQSLMRISYAVFCLKKKKRKNKQTQKITTNNSKSERHTM